MAQHINRVTVVGKLLHTPDENIPDNIDKLHNASGLGVSYLKDLIDTSKADNFYLHYKDVMGVRNESKILIIENYCNKKIKELSRNEFQKFIRTPNGVISMITTLVAVVTICYNLFYTPKTIEKSKQELYNAIEPLKKDLYTRNQERKDKALFDSLLRVELSKRNLKPNQSLHQK